jgi:hypothetical protein
MVRAPGPESAWPLLIPTTVKICVDIAAHDWAAMLDHLKLHLADLSEL